MTAERGHAHSHVHEADHALHGHGHPDGLVDPSIVRSRAGIRAVSLSLAVLAAAALAQTAVFLISDSVALLADLIHNFGDALTALPLGAAFLLRSARGEKLAGLFVVFVIFVSACVALWQTIERLIDPRELSHLGAIAAAGVIGFVGNEIAAQIRTRAGRRLESPAPVADGNHGRADGFRLARRRRERGSGRTRSRDRRSADRPADHDGDPEGHLGLMAHRPRKMSLTTPDDSAVCAALAMLKQRGG